MLSQIVPSIPSQYLDRCYHKKIISTTWRIHNIWRQDIDICGNIKNIFRKYGPALWYIREQLSFKNPWNEWSMFVFVGFVYVRNIKWRDRNTITCGLPWLTIDLVTHEAISWWCPLTILVGIKVIHDDVIEWKHFPRYWPFVREIHRSPVNSPHKGMWHRALMFSLIYAWTNGKQSIHRWFETSSRSLWRHCNAYTNWICVLVILDNTFAHTLV